MLLVSPAEPPSLRALGIVSPICEQNGMDFMWTCHDGTFAGAQRKAVSDLVASIRGDRIARELGQAESIQHRILIVEGDWEWNATGQSRRVRSFTRAQFDGVMLSIQVEYGWMVLHSGSLADTGRLLGRLQAWFQKESHGSLSRRPKPRANVEVKWGASRHRATGIHILQSFDGVGPKAAGAIFDHFGRVPLELVCTQDELRAVPGVGPVIVKRIAEALA